MSEADALRPKVHRLTRLYYDRGVLIGRWVMLDLTQLEGTFVVCRLVCAKSRARRDAS